MNIHKKQERKRKKKWSKDNEINKEVEIKVSTKYTNQQLASKRFAGSRF